MRLTAGEATVNELAEPFAMTQQAISRHVKVLERAGLISRERTAQFRPCRLEPARLDTAADWIAENRRMWDERYDRMDRHLATLRGRASAPDPTPAPTPTPPRPGHRERHRHRHRGAGMTTDLGELTYRRVHKAPRELLFEVMTTPEHLAHFWGRPAPPRPSTASSSTCAPAARSRR